MVKQVMRSNVTALKESYSFCPVKRQEDSGMDTVSILVRALTEIWIIVLLDWIRKAGCLNCDNATRIAEWTPCPLASPTR